jgi:hypothetical protein
MYLTEFKPHGGAECEFQQCDRMAHFRVMINVGKPTGNEFWFCSCCMAKCIEAVMGMRATVQELEGT